MLQKDENYDDHHDEQDFYHGSYGKKEDEDYVVYDFKVLDLEDYYEDPASVQNKLSRCAGMHQHTQSPH